MLLVGNADGEIQESFGSGIIIAPNLVMTANHVILDFWNRHGGGKPLEGEQTATFGIHALPMRNREGQPSAWRVMQY